MTRMRLRSLAASLVAFGLALLAGAVALAAAPEISYVTPGVNHWEPFLVLGEGLDGPKVEVVHWAPRDDRDPADLLPDIITHGLPRPPVTPPEGSVVNVYGRVRHLSPQAISGVMMYHAAVFWVRSPAGLSQPYVVNRPRPYFLEYETATPGQEIRLFGRELCRAMYPPKARMWLVDRQSGKSYEAPRGQKYDFQGHLNYQLVYELRFKLPDDVPPGEYQVYCHNGANREFGFGGPLPLTIRAPKDKKRPLFSVADYGAKGDGATDDTGAIEKTLFAAAETGGVVHFPPGVYLVSAPLRVAPGVDVRGADAQTCRLVAAPGFAGAFPKSTPPAAVQQVAGAFKHVSDRPILYLVSNSTVSELALRGNDETATLIAVEGLNGPAQDVTVTRCQLFNPRALLLTKGWEGGGTAFRVYGPLQRIELSWCDLRAFHGLHVDMFALPRRCRTLFNTYSPPAGPFGTNGMGWMMGEHCIVEGNIIRQANRGFTCGPWAGPVQYNFVARNQILEGGRVEGGGESILFENGECGGENWVGHPSVSGPDYLTQTERKLKTHVLRGRLALVVAGPGFGQLRTVADNTEDKVTVTEPWRIPPTPDSWVVVRQCANDNILLNNVCRDTWGGIQLSGAVNNVVERSVGERCGYGVWFVAANMQPPGERLYYAPSAFNEIRNSLFTDMADGALLSSDRRLEHPTPLPLQFGNRIVGNQFTHSQIHLRDGVLQTAQGVSWLSLDDVRLNNLAPSNVFNLIGGNAFDEFVGRPAMTFSRFTLGTTTWINKLAATSYTEHGSDQRVPAPIGGAGQGTVDIPR